MKVITPQQPAPQGRVTDDDLLAMPSDWRFVPVNGNKKPLGGNDWGIVCADRDADFYLGLNGNRPVALGLLLGPQTGTLAIDRDNEGWRGAFKRRTGHDIDELPRTIAWTSGKPGRMQQAYTVPKEWQPLIQGSKESNAEGKTCLEFRWGTQVMSVVCGVHPETGSYRWVEGCSPQQLGDPAEAPEWLLEKMLAPQYDDTEQPAPTEADAIEAVAILSLLQPKDFQAHDPWIKVGMALHHVGVDVGHWIEWSRTMATFDEKECRTRWKSFAKYSRRKVGIGSLRRWGIPYGHIVPTPPAETIPVELLQPGPPADRLRQRFNVARETSTATPVVLSAETPGFGKTRLVAPFSRLIRADGIKLVIYVSTSYRSPSDPALALWATTAARHPGLVEKKVNGMPKVIRQKRGEKLPLVEQPTCRFSHVLDQLAAQGVSAEGRAEWCKACTEYDFCPFVAQQEHLVSDLQQGTLQQLRTTIGMLPAIKEWAGKKRWAATVVVVDEAPQLLDAAVQDHAISYAQLRQWTHYIYNNDLVTGKGLLLELVRILANMPQRFEEEDARIKRNTYERYGFNVQETAAELADWKATAGNFFDGWHLGLVDQIELPATDDPDADGELPVPLLLPHLIRAALNTDGTSLSCDANGVNIYEPADDVRDALNASAGVLILDGTTDPSDVRTWAAADPESFAAVRSSEDSGLQNVQIVQVHGMGTMSSSREKSRHADRDEFIAHATLSLMQHLEKTEPHVGVIDHKKFARQGMGYWGADHRGTNAYADADALIACGLPLQALGPALARFATAHCIALAGDGFSEAFSAWYERRLAEDLLQTIHRLRPLRRAGQNLTAWILSDRPIHIPGATITAAKAQAFSPLIGSTAHRGLDRLADLINSRTDISAPITQAQAAALLHQLLSSQPATRSAASTPASLERQIRRHLKAAGFPSWRHFLHAQTWCADTWAAP